MTVSSTLQSMPKKEHKRISTLTLIILMVNLIPIVLMGFGILYLDKYKQNLLKARYQNMEEKAELIGHYYAHSGGSLDQIANVRRPEAIYILSPKGIAQKLTQKNLLSGTPGEVSADELDIDGGFFEALAKLVVFLNPLDTALENFPGLTGANATKGLPEVRDAFQGHIAINAWETQNDFFLTLAFPLYQSGESISDSPQKVLYFLRSGADLTRAIDDVRIDIVKAFLVVAIITFLMSIYLSSFIAMPLKRLERAAEEIRKGNRELTAIPDLSYRKDEIGELSLIIREMNEALNNRIHTIERFTADVSHELKNPLTSLRSAVETARKVTKKEDQKRLFDIIEEDVERMDRLITDISYTSRLDRALAKDMFHEIDLNKLLKELIDLWRSPLNRGGIVDKDAISEPINWYPSQESCIVVGKPDSLIQVFQNLLSNALSFAPSGTAVEVYLRKNPASQKAAVFIDDCGTGVPEHLQEKIFERFYTDRPGNYTEKTNSGLGLAIAKQIIQTHGGEISVENRLDDQGGIQGARFTVFLKTIS